GLVALVALAACWLPAAAASQAAQRGGGVAARRAYAVRGTSSRASALLNRAFADAEAAGSFRQIVTQVYGTTRGTLEDDVALHAGRQSIRSSDGTRAQVLVVGKRAYISGNQRALSSYFKFTTDERAAIGSGWVSIPPTSTAYAQVSFDVTVPTALQEVAPTGQLKEGRATTVDGMRVIGISGTAPAVVSAGGTGTDTLYVTASRHPLPVAAAMQATVAPRPQLTMTVTMSHWGERVRVSPPAAEVPLSALPTLAHVLAARAIPHAPGYFTLTGSRGYPAPAGRPWGAACTPVRLAAQASVPNALYAELAAVVRAARRQGVDVTLESRRGAWRHSSLYYRFGQRPATSVVVELGASSATPPRLADGKAEHIRLAWDTRLDGDKHNEDLTLLRGTLWLRALVGQPELVRRAIRQLIAMTQGVALTTASLSGISAMTAPDRFSSSDVAAMLTMSGCSLSPASTTTTTGIAA
ncbi:MAG: hypothetical protein KGL16_11665, partial [Acidobacteriota bacterium]|nr:hypothetical protein [Acidobacteriota bacterium]